MANPFARREAPQREVENLIGWRKMKILPVGLLVSPLREGGMTSTLSEEAVCDGHPTHDAPEGDCGPPGCGWYAFYAANDIYGAGRGRAFQLDEAIVEVSAVGKTWLHDKGFRTKQIRMESIWVPKGTDAGLSATLGEMYDLPVYEIPGQKEMEDTRAADTANQERKVSDPPPSGLLQRMSSEEFMKQFLGTFTEGSTFEWKSGSGKSSSQPSRQSEPSGKSPLTSGQQEIQKLQEEANNLLSRRQSQSQFGSRQVREQAEYDLARARAELNHALGKCVLCDKTDAHTHDMTDLKGESGG